MTMPTVWHCLKGAVNSTWRAERPVGSHPSAVFNIVAGNVQYLQTISAYEF